MLNKTATIHSLTQDFLKAVLPYVKGPSGDKLLKRDGHADIDLDDDELVKKNPIGVMQGTEVLINNIEDVASRNGIETDAAFLLLAREVSQYIKTWPKMESLDDLERFLEGRRGIKNDVSRQTANALTNALNNFGLNFVL